MSNTQVKKYRKKPVVIEALLWDGTNTGEVADFLQHSPVFHIGASGGNKVVIKTLEGDITAATGDYIIKGAKGEFYLCKPDIFEATYEEV